MKKFALAIVIAAVAASPAMAAKKSKKKMAAPPAASTNSNENSARFARDSLPIFLPSWLMPAYVANNPK
jgi:hypothetical protein